MKHIICSLLFVLISSIVFAQIDTTKQENDTNAIFQPVEIEAQYVGGVAAWLQYVRENIRYPKKAERKFTSGTTHFFEVQIIIRKDSTALFDTIRNEDPGFGFKEEIIRLITAGGKWKPAIQNGRVVQAFKRIQVVFKHP